MANKDILFIFDSSAKAGKIADLMARRGAKQLDLFPLTGDLSILQKMDASLLREGIETVFRYDTSALVDEQVSCLREKICKWSADIGGTKVGQKNVREWFLLPGCGVSAWWFSLFAEKNPFKTDVFLGISQIRAVEYALNKKEYGLVLIAISDRNLRQALKKVVAKLAIPVEIVPLVRGGGLKEWSEPLFNNFRLCIDILRGFKLFFNFIKRKNIVKLYLPPRKERLRDSNPILFVTYFPLIEEIPAQKGIFRNRYAPALQDKLKEAGMPITWILMYSPIDRFSFVDAVLTAKRFVDNGEKLFFCEEFLSFKDAAYGLSLWVRQICVGLFLFNFIKEPLVSAPAGEECGPFMKSLWSESFYGPIGLGGILSALSFRKMFKEIKNADNCIYYFEMQPWEHTLNSAKNKEQPGIRNIGFQHSSIPKNSFNYFYDRSETRRTSSHADLPLPDVIASSGEITQDLLAGSGYPAVTRLESLRYLYFDEILSSPASLSKERRTLVVVGSGIKEESLRLIALIRSAFPRAASFEICFKGHPSFPFEELFKDLGIDAKEHGYIVNHDDISASLKKAFAVISLSSTVMIEALAFGCEVIVPVYPDILSLNPLVGFEKYYHKITDKEELARTVEKIANGYSLCDIREYRDFVRKYWDIDRGIPGWMKLLNAREAI